MNLLAFDTCLDKTYVTLYVKNNFINKVILSNDKNYHSAYLISTIVEILKANAVTKVEKADKEKKDSGVISFRDVFAFFSALVVILNSGYYRSIVTDSYLPIIFFMCVL